MSQGRLFEDEGGIGDAIGALERWCRRQGLRWIVGVDEAGRGPLAGPVHAAAVVVDVDEFDEVDWLAGADDSKSLEAPERERLFERIDASAPARAVAASGPETIDRLDIRTATQRAMEEVVGEVAGAVERIDGVFVDGRMQLEIDYRQRSLVDGDGRSRAIAAASILAKVSRDEHMREAAEKWPQYGFASNFGYPTRDHRRAIEELGPCPIHRRSFSGVE